MATGGLRQKRALNTVEVFDPKRPKVSSGDTSKGDLQFYILQVKLKTHHFYSLSGWMEEAEQVEDAGCSFGALRGHPQRSSSALFRE